MKTTLDIPDELFREVKAKAALEGRKLKDVVAESLRATLAGVASPSKGHRVEFPLINAQPGKSVITQQQVDEAENVMLAEEAEHHAGLMRLK